MPKNMLGGKCWGLDLTRLACCGASTCRSLFPAADCEEGCLAPQFVHVYFSSHFSFVCSVPLLLFKNLTMTGDSFLSRPYSIVYQPLGCHSFALTPVKLIPFVTWPCWLLPSRDIIKKPHTAERFLEWFVSITNSPL